MKELAKIVVFSLVILFGFAAYTRYGLPLIVPEPPPVEETVSGDITMEEFIALGQKLYDGKGTCTLCHNPVGGRAPILDDAGAVALARIKEEGYKGEALTGEAYLMESLVAPSAYVVPGFGKTGTNDTVSPMPDVSRGAIGLNEVELGAVVAYLQSISGVDVTVNLPTGDAPVAEEEDEAGDGEISVAATAAEAFEKFECATCHAGPAIDDGGDMGPDLGEMAKTAGSRKAGMSAREFIYESIVDPNAVVADDYDSDMMPDDYGQRMTLAEFQLMADAMLGGSAGE